MEYVNGLLSVFFVGLLGFLIYGPWQQFCIDRARNVLFEARDELFLLAARGHLDFNSREYRELREGFNDLIRFAHKISWPRILFFVATCRSSFLTVVPMRKRALDQISDADTRRLIERQIWKSNVAVVELLVFRSVILLSVAAIAAIVASASNRIRKVRSQMARSVADVIQCEAEQYESSVRPDRRRVAA